MKLSGSRWLQGGGVKGTVDRCCTTKCRCKVRARPPKQAAVLMARLHMLIYREGEEKEEKNWNRENCKTNRILKPLNTHYAGTVASSTSARTPSLAQQSRFGSQIGWERSATVHTTTAAHLPTAEFQAAAV